MLTRDDIGRRLSAAMDLARNAIELIVDEHVERDARWKGWADWVTGVDLAVERHVREVLADLFPEDAVIGEELANPEVVSGKATWYLDPIDGTTNFVHGLRSCSFSLALADDAGLALGVVADPWREEIFEAVRGGGARANGRSLRCRRDTGLEGGLVLTELKGSAPWPGMTDLMEELGRSGCVTRVLGSCALSLANIAAGRAAGLVLGSANPTDVAAGTLLAREAGAVVLTGAALDPVLSSAAPEPELKAPVALVASAPDVLGGLLRALGQ